MNNYLKVDNDPTLFRDSLNNSVINNNYNQYELYLKRKQQKELECNKLTMIENDIEVIRKDIEEIKSLILSISK